MSQWHASLQPDWFKSGTATPATAFGSVPAQAFGQSAPNAVQTLASAGGSSSTQGQTPSAATQAATSQITKPSYHTPGMGGFSYIGEEEGGGQGWKQGQQAMSGLINANLDQQPQQQRRPQQNQYSTSGSAMQGLAAAGGRNY